MHGSSFKLSRVRETLSNLRCSQAFFSEAQDVSGLASCLLLFPYDRSPLPELRVPDPYSSPFPQKDSKSRRRDYDRETSNFKDDYVLFQQWTVNGTIRKFLLSNIFLITCLELQFQIQAVCVQRSFKILRSYRNVYWSLVKKSLAGRHSGQRGKGSCPSLGSFIPTSDALLTNLTPHATKKSYNSNVQNLFLFVKYVIGTVQDWKLKLFSFTKL